MQLVEVFGTITPLCPVLVMLVELIDVLFGNCMSSINSISTSRAELQPSPSLRRVRAT